VHHDQSARRGDPLDRRPGDRVTGALHYADRGDAQVQRPNHGCVAQAPLWSLDLCNAWKRSSLFGSVKIVSRYIAILSLASAWSCDLFPQDAPEGSGRDNPSSKWPDSLMVAALPVEERRRYE
jgi:hypothetical protein